MRVDRTTDTIWLTRAPRVALAPRGAGGAIWLRTLGLAAAAAMLAAFVGSAEGPDAAGVKPAAGSPKLKEATRLPRWKGQDATAGAASPTAEPGRGFDVLDPRPAAADGRFALAAADATASFGPAAFSPPPAPAENWRQGAFEAVTVLDGRTFAAGALRIRLAGLEVPGADEACRTLDGRLESCAARAATQLELLTRSRVLACRYLPDESGEEAVGQCRLGSADLAERLVRTGYLRRASAAPRAAELPQPVGRS